MSIQLENNRARLINCASVNSWLFDASFFSLDRFSSRSRYKRELASNSPLLIKSVIHTPTLGFPITFAEELNSLENDSLTSLDDVAIKGECLAIIRSEACAMALHLSMSREGAASISCPASSAFSFELLNVQTAFLTSDAELVLQIVSNSPLVIADEDLEPKKD